MGLVEEVKPIAKANVEETHVRGSGPLGDPAVEARGLCLGGFTSTGSLHAQNSVGRGLSRVSVTLSPL